MEFLDGFHLVSFGVQALGAGKLRARRKWRLPDALIVASALNHEAEFLISNDDSVGKKRHQIRRKLCLPPSF